MEGKLGRLISKVTRKASPQQTHADIERRLPGIYDRLEDVRLRMQEPHIEYELTEAAEAIPVYSPGSTAVEISIQAGIEPPRRVHLTPGNPLMSGSLSEIADPRLRHEAVTARRVTAASPSRT